MEGSITLIIKAANQSVPDHRMDCNCDWTVSHLKNHLSAVHPSKPRVDEQRLIYSGQLLLDELKLRSVLRHPTENNSYTIHLVCSPPRNAPVPSPANTQPLPPVSTQRSPLRAGGGGVATATTAAAAMTVPQHEGSAPPPPTSTSSSSDTSVNSESTDGIRRRIVNVNSDDVSGSTPQGIEAAAGYPSQAQVSMSVLQAGTDPIQQMATMQQMYANYMAYMQYMQMGGGLGGGGVTWPQQMLHHVPPAPNPASSTPSAASAAAAAADQSEPQQQQQLPDQNVPLNQQQQQQQQQPAPQIRMNAQGGEVEDDDENEGMGRDWLDWIYVLSRMVVLLSVVYFYSTISRFMVVVCIAMMLYLYQAGWFRPTRRPAEQPPREGNENELNDAQDDRNNNVNNNNNNNEVPGEALIVENQEQQQQQQQVPPPPQQQPLPNDNGDVGVGTDRAVENEELHVRPSILALSWTFLTTFFTSLIPEQPQVI